MIAYSPKSLRAIAYLFRPYNDIDIYVEDISGQNMYEVLINRILDGKAKVSRVIQVGDKLAIIKLCSIEQKPSTRCKLFIIDGDYEFVAGAAQPPLKYLHRLNVYTSENLLLCDKAVGEVCVDSMPNSPKGEIEGIVRYQEFIEGTTALLTPLFVVYFAIYLLTTSPENASIDAAKTTGFNVMNLCTQAQKVPVLGKDKLVARRNDLIKEMRTIYDSAKVDNALEIAKARFNIPVHERVRLISAKTYLLPLLYHHIRHKSNFIGTMESLKVRLARHTKLDISQGLSEAVLNAARGGN